MTGEIPTETSVLQQVKDSIRLAADYFDGDSQNPEDSIIEDIVLQGAYAAIHKLYAHRGESNTLISAVTEAIHSDEENLRERAELLERFGFGSDTEAAEHIISYWQGEKPEYLLRSVMGLGDIEMWKQASKFASDATANNPDSQKSFRDASDLLWRNYRGGQG